MAQTYSSIKEAGVSPTRNLIWNPSQWDTSIWEDNDFNASGGTLDKRCFSNIGWNVASIGGNGFVSRDAYEAQGGNVPPDEITNNAPYRVFKTIYNDAADRYIMYCTAIRFTDFKAEDPNFGTSLASPLTLSFWVKSDVTGTFIAELASKQAFINFNPGFYRNSQTYTINAANTWEYKTVYFQPFTTPAGYQDFSVNPPVEYNYEIRDQYFALNFWLAAGTNYKSGTLNNQWSFNNDDTNRAVGITTNYQTTENAQWAISSPQLECSPVATKFSIAPHKDYSAVRKAVVKSPVRGGITLTGDAFNSNKSYVMFSHGNWGGNSQNISILQTGSAAWDIDLSVSDKNQMGSNRMFSASSGTSSTQVTADFIDPDGNLRIDQANFQPGQDRAQTLAFFDRAMLMTSQRFYEANNN
tara:strand:- start:1835 stop:3070 length:1236 start_codon:yes stop_codon:yes gene_type:complete